MTTEPAIDAKEAWKRWEAGQADLVVESINELREYQNLTIKDVAQRLGTFGWPVSTSTLLGILSGKKRTSFSTGEILALASAVNVPPLTLLLGLPAAEGYPMVPGDGRSSSNLERFEWVTGNRHYNPELVDTDEAQGTWDSAALELSEMRQYAHALQAVQWQNSLVQVMPEFEGESLAKALPEWMIRGSKLREGLDSLWDIYQRYPMLPLPGALKSLSSPDFDALTASIPIPNWSTPEELQRARAYIRDRIAGVDAWEPRRRFYSGE